MKRIWVTILLLAYFTVSSGFVVNLHYCMGDLAGMEIGHPEKKDCGKCGMPLKKKAGCCDDEVKVLKVEQDQSAATFAVFHFGVAQDLPVPAFFPFEASEQAAFFQAAPAHAPPLIGEQDTYLYNRVFRI